MQENGTGLKLISDEIREYLKCPVDVLMGANLAPEVANDMFCEATIGKTCREAFRLSIFVEIVPSYQKLPVLSKWLLFLPRLITIL